MTGPVSWTRAVGALIASIALISATAVDAQRYRTSWAEASAAHQKAEDEANEEMYEFSCADYGKAIKLYSNAIDQLATMTDSSTADRNFVISEASLIKDNADLAIAGAEIVCGRPNVPNYRYEKREAQRIVALSASQTSDAVRQYEAGDFVAACASSRLAAEGFGQVARDLKANPQLEATFVNSAQLYENAIQTAADRDEFYCKK